MPRPDGAALRAWRLSRHWAVPELARQIRRSADSTHIAGPDALKAMIHKWERDGVEISERYMLLYCAVFQVTPEQLADGPAQHRRTVASTPMPSSPVTPQPPVARWAAAIYEAVINSSEATRRASRLLNEAPALPSLRSRAEEAVAAELAADYARLAAALPHLIGAAELAAFHAPDRDYLAAHDLLAHVYITTAWTLIKADTAGAAWIAAQRALQAAETAGDRLRAAAATRCLAEVHMRAGEHSDATRTAFLATTYLYSGPADDEITLVLRGSALLSAAAASARRGDAREARASFTAATACAEPMHAERSDFGAVFGPVNTAIHRVAVAVELGDYQAAVDAIPAVNLGMLPPQLAERRARYLIDVARAHAGLCDDQAAEDALREAVRAAPDELRGHRLTRVVLQDLLGRERRSSGVRDLAARCEVLAG
jgi:tetratricopeptide (TPR) repeat protein